MKERHLSTFMLSVGECFVREGKLALAPAPSTTPLIADRSWTEFRKCSARAAIAMTYEFPPLRFGYHEFESSFFEEMVRRHQSLSQTYPAGGKSVLESKHLDGV
ncbi:MAG TPA: hypothetical protein VIK28_00290 [Sedimentisphaerales bacterium]